MNTAVDLSTVIALCFSYPYTQDTSPCKLTSFGIVCSWHALWLPGATTLLTCVCVCVCVCVCLVCVCVQPDFMIFCEVMPVSGQLFAGIAVVPSIMGKAKPNISLKTCHA